MVKLDQPEILSPVASIPTFHSSSRRRYAEIYQALDKLDNLLWLPFSCSGLGEARTLAASIVQKDDGKYEACRRGQTVYARKRRAE